eukprot:TRINITY_DN13468_c0_g1_i1.p1 TRINITY_DN13468_c0_g1~~TRINITY_DN13468_c0_g1_i1.p1  ORF type:complete len:131 (-),score=35.95 TRINITY_DN13468_c0_g1_i1:79-471(-)
MIADRNMKSEFANFLRKHSILDSLLFHQFLCRFQALEDPKSLNEGQNKAFSHYLSPDALAKASYRQLVSQKMVDELFQFAQPQPKMFDSILDVLTEFLETQWLKMGGKGAPKTSKGSTKKRKIFGFLKNK